MKTLEFNQMESVQGGSNQTVACFMGIGLMASGVAIYAGLAIAALTCGILHSDSRM